MTQEDINELAEAFLLDITKYMSEYEEINLKFQIKQYLDEINYIKKDQLMIDVVRANLVTNGYFEKTKISLNHQYYKLAPTGVAFYRKIKEIRDR